MVGHDNRDNRILTHIHTQQGEEGIDTLKPGFVALFSFSFALAMGAVWEIFEFSMDASIGFNMQRTDTGVFDTMSDLIVDTLGALFVCIAGYFYLKKDPKIFKRLEDRLLK